MDKMTIEELCNKVENILEQFVIENKGRLFQNGMETEIHQMFNNYVKKFLLEKRMTFENLSSEHQGLIKNRLEKFLEFSKKVYYS